MNQSNLAAALDVDARRHDLMAIATQEFDAIRFHEEMLPDTIRWFLDYGASLEVPVDLLCDFLVESTDDFEPVVVRANYGDEWPYKVHDWLRQFAASYVPSPFEPPRYHSNQRVEAVLDREPWYVAGPIERVHWESWGAARPERDRSEVRWSYWIKIDSGDLHRVEESAIRLSKS